jgi:coenzyme F420-reducing hydrogenase delta subunit
MQYPPAIKIIELPCTGRIDLPALFNTVEDGADGIMVAG